MTEIQSHILLPSHGLADLPGQLAGDDADEMLAMWTAAWHPLLIEATGQLPDWSSADSPPSPSHAAIVFLSQAARGWLAADGRQQAEDRRLIVSDVNDQHGHALRDELVRRVLAWLESSSTSQVLPDTLTADLVADFYAFGYWYLQTELLSYQLRYTSGLDRSVVGEKLVPAAAAAVAGRTQEARRLLAAGFGILADTRAHYYPVDSYLLDLTLVAKFNCVDELMVELGSGHMRNIWMTGETLEHLARTSPATLDELAKAIAEGRAALVGGEWNELPTSLVPRDMVARNLSRGCAEFEVCVGAAPTVFARRRFGLAPALPALLNQAGFVGAVHSTFDDGRVVGLPARTEWRGEGGAVIQALAQKAMDASLPETALGLGVAMGQSMEADFVATIVLARWAGQRTDWLDEFEQGLRF